MPFGKWVRGWAKGVNGAQSTFTHPNIFIEHLVYAKYAYNCSSNVIVEVIDDGNLNYSGIGDNWKAWTYLNNILVVKLIGKNLTMVW